MCVACPRRRAVRWCLRTQRWRCGDAVSETFELAHAALEMHGYKDTASWIDDVRPALRLLDVKHEDGHYCALTFPGSGEHVRMASLAKLAVALTYVVVGRRKMRSSRSPATSVAAAENSKPTLEDLAFVAAAVNMAPRCRASQPRPAAVATPPRMAFALVIRHRDASAAGSSKRQARDEDDGEGDTEAEREVKVLRRELQIERRQNWISARLVEELKTNAEEMTRDHDHVLVSLAQAKARLELLGERDG